jgi:hypothetical protein
MSEISRHDVKSIVEKATQLAEESGKPVTEEAIVSWAYLASMGAVDGRQVREYLRATRRGVTLPNEAYKAAALAERRYPGVVIDLDTMVTTGYSVWIAKAIHEHQKKVLTVDLPNGQVVLIPENSTYAYWHREHLGLDELPPLR